MRYLNKWIGDSLNEFLEVTVYDDDDVTELSKYRHEKNVIVSLSYIKHLKDFINIEKLIITSGEASDDMYDIFRKMTSLTALKIDYEETEPSTKWCIDISAFPNLKYLFSRSSYNFQGISFSKTLKTLYVLKWYEKDLIRLSGTYIDSLCISSGKLHSLNGIEGAPIQVLSLSNLRNLKDISSAETLPLKILELRSCNQIPSLEEFSSGTLEYLMIYGKNKVNSGNFILRFKQLKRVMLDIMIDDGDLSCFDNLEHAVIFINKKHYNRTNSTLPKSKKRYMIKNIPNWRYIFFNRFI